MFVVRMQHIVSLYIDVRFYICAICELTLIYR
jgi:hypothetical protein